MMRSLALSGMGLLILVSTAAAQRTAANNQLAAPVPAQETSPARLMVADPAVTPAAAPSPMLGSGQLQATPEMWFYEQSMRNYKDPQMAVRAKAEFEAQQRQRRLAAMRWFGFSNSRPHWGVDSFHGVQSPGWSSNNPASPYQWQGVGQPWYLARPERAEVRVY